MKGKFCEIITIVASLAVIVLACVYLVTQEMIPGLLPFALAIVMLTMYLNKKVVSNRKWLRVLFLSGILLNIIAGGLQIYIAFKK